MLKNPKTLIDEVITEQCESAGKMILTAIREERKSIRIPMSDVLYQDQWKTELERYGYTVDSVAMPCVGEASVSYFEIIWP